jgi:uncharacterized protein (TIGR02391 family)
MNCIITELPIRDRKEFDTHIEYFIDYKRKPYKLKLPVKDDLSDDYKKALKSLLFREEWPIDQEFLITKPLAERAFGWIKYPTIQDKDFEPKVLAYLEWLYKNGGKEHKPLHFIASEYWQARAYNEDEFARVLEALEHKEYITKPVSNEFKLTKEGAKKAESMEAQKPESPLKKYATVRKPRIGIINIMGDEIAANKVANYFSNKGFPALTYNGLDDDEVGGGRIHNLRNQIREENGRRQADYWVFIKSAKSDKSRTYGSLLTVAAEAHHELGWMRYPNMITIAETDDSNRYTWPVYDDYYNHFFDVRLDSGKERLAEDILEDWAKMLEKKLKTKDAFWTWLSDLCKQLGNNCILIRPFGIEELLESEEQLRGFLDELIKENLVTVHQLPGCKNDQFEYEVRVLTDADRLALEKGYNWNFIHPVIQNIAKSRFESGHYADAAEASIKEINDIVKRAYKTEKGVELDGVDLMRKAFTSTANNQFQPVFPMADNTTDSGKNIQQGYMDIFVGAITGIRNPKTHGNLDRSPDEVWEMIVLASHLMRMWDKRLSYI